MIDPKISRKARELLKSALTNFYDCHGLLGFTLAKVKHIETDQIPSAGISDKELLYNPEFLAAHSQHDVNFITVHEGAHSFLGHPVRFAKLVHEFEAKYCRKLNVAEYNNLHRLMNIAADLALNQFIEKMRCAGKPSPKLVEYGCFIGKDDFKDLEPNKSMEHYFRKLFEKAQQQQQQQQQQKGNNEKQDGQQSQQQDGSNSGQGGEESQDSGESGGAGEGQGSGSGQGSAGDDQQGAGSGADGEGTGGNKQGSGAEAGSGKGGAKASDEGDGAGSGRGDQSGGSVEGTRCSSRRETTLERIGDTPICQRQLAPGEINPAKAETQEELEKAEQAWQNSVAQAIIQAKSQGLMPGWMKELADEIFGETGIDWRVKLRRFFDKITRDGWSYAKPSRRHSWRKEIIMPCRRGRTSGLGCVIVDTSGSMSNEECTEALKVLSEILHQLPGEPEVEMMQIDTRIANRRTFKRHDFPLRVPTEWHGRGGTDLTPAMNELAANRQKYKWAICVTDGYWPFDHVTNPKVPMIWLFTRKHEKSPQFGETMLVTVKN